VTAGHRADADAFDRYTMDPNGATEQERQAAYRHARRNDLLPRRSSVDLLIRQGELGRRTS